MRLGKGAFWAAFWALFLLIAVFVTWFLSNLLYSLFWKVLNDWGSPVTEAAMIAYIASNLAPFLLTLCAASILAILVRDQLGKAIATTPVSNAPRKANGIPWGSRMVIGLMVMFAGTAIGIWGLSIIASDGHLELPAKQIADAGPLTPKPTTEIDKLPREQPVEPPAAKPKYMRAEAEKLIPGLQQLRSIVQDDIVSEISKSTFPNFEQNLTSALMPGVYDPGMSAIEQDRKRWTNSLTAEIDALNKIKDAINSGRAQAAALVRSNEYRDYKDILVPFTESLSPGQKFDAKLSDYITTLKNVMGGGQKPAWVVLKPHDEMFKNECGLYLASLAITIDTITAKITEIREHTQ